jgi:hypothetical protein
LRWEDGVDQDTRTLEVKNWKKVALDRDEWAKLLKKARAHQGAVEPMMIMMMIHMYWYMYVNVQSTVIRAFLLCN